MNHQSYADNCVSRPVGHCLCNGIPVIFCVTQLIEHIKINRDHTILDTITNPLSEFHTNLLNINRIKISLKTTKRSVISDKYEIIKVVNILNQTCQSHMKKLIKECNEIFRIALQDEILEL